MKEYQKKWLVLVLSADGQTLSDELRFHILATNDDLHPRLQIKNPAICLQTFKKKKSLLSYICKKRKYQ